MNVMNQKQKDELVANSLIVCKYIQNFTSFENHIREIFFHEIAQVDSAKKNQLYFYLGGIVSNKICYGYDDLSLYVDKSKYSSAENFKVLSLTQIIRIDKKAHLVKAFDFNIPSFTTKSLYYTFHDCCISLISMRNKVAHEFSSLRFDSKDVIEVLSKECIRMNIDVLQADINLDAVSEEVIKLLYNLIFMKRISDNLVTRRE